MMSYGHTAYAPYQWYADQTAHFEDFKTGVSDRRDERSLPEEALGRAAV